MSFVVVSRQRHKNFVQAVLSQDSAALAEQEAELNRRVRQEVARQRTRLEAEARAQAQQAAQATLAPELAALQTATAVLQSAAAQLTAPLAQKEQDLAALVTELGFLLARHILGVEAASHPAGLQNLVAKLLAEATLARGPRQRLLLRVNPADQAHLASHVPPEAADLLADECISQGGVRLELATPDGDPLDRVEWDATLESRLDAIRTALSTTGGGA